MFQPVQPPPPVPSATGRDPWATLLRTPPAPPPLDVQQIAFGNGNLTQDPRYASANLPPYNDANR